MKLNQYIVLFLFAVVTAGCHLIDDDLSVCGADYLIHYRMNLVTEVNTTIDEKLSSDMEKPVADALKLWAEPYFMGHAHDLDMSFFSLDGTDELLEHKSDIIDASQKSYTLYIPRMDYQHLAVVNIKDNENASLMGGQYASSMCIAQREADTLPSHNTAIYTARLPMYMPENDSDLSFNVHLYMASCAVAIVQTNQSTTSLRMARVLLSGTASRFSINDSLYTFNHTALIRAEKVLDNCYAMLSLPSRDSITGTSGMQARAKRADETLWQLKVYIPTADSKVTETILSFPYPLKAGTMEIIKIEAQEDGSAVVIGNPDVGASVTLDWKEGNEHDVTTG